MKQRSLIKSQIIQAWQRSIEKDYRNQRINSERSLQAAFWACLNKLLLPTRRLFIEPTMKIEDRSGIRRIVPDIVVCNTRQIIAVVELKYTPRGKPVYKKDLGNLAAIASCRRRIVISNDRFRGSEKDTTSYPLAPNVLFVWAGVHVAENAEQSPLYSAPYSSLRDCFLELHAQTSRIGAPEIFQRY